MPDSLTEALQRPFGAASRKELLEEYFASAGSITADNAWQHVYRLLLWTDQTTGLAHCYESDKTQPGRPWYARSLAFHGWAADQLGSSPAELSLAIDWLFRRGTERLTEALASREGRLAKQAAKQRTGFEDYPVPGEDPELEKLLLEDFGGWLRERPSEEALLAITRRLGAYFRLENKRKNLVGEGFEDVLQALVLRLRTSSTVFVMVRPVLHDVPGFRHPPANEKPRKVDLVIITQTGRRILVSAKWSVRADREEQFEVDYATYARLEEHGEDFDFVLITNEFDAARLGAACDRRREGRALFSSVVHVNPEGPLAAYGSELRRSAERLPVLVESGRLASLGAWLKSLEL